MVPNSPAASERAETAAAQGDGPAGARLLEAAAERGDTDAAYVRAAWAFAGRHIARDLAAARHWFGRAAALGHRQAQTIHIALLANGTGGARDWRGAVALLDALAATDADARRQQDLIAAMSLTPEGDSAAPPSGRELHDAPAIHYFEALLSPGECDYLIDAAAPLLEPSTIIDPATRQLARHPVRTSDVAAFPLAYESPVIHAINRRLAMASGTDARQGEPLQILRYGAGQEYRPHLDALPDAANQRVATMLVYLNDDYAGGETAFLELGLQVRGRKGDALLFRNSLADGRADMRTRHAGLPIQSGVKWIASRWIRAEPLDLGMAPSPS